MEKNQSKTTGQQKTADMDKFTEVVENQLQLTTKKRKIQMLTLFTSLMRKRSKIKDTSNVSDYSIRQTEKLVKEKGFPAETGYRCGKKLKLKLKKKLHY